MRRFCFSLAILFGGCNSVVLPGPSVGDAGVQDAGPLPPAPDIDILFVVDNSSSMADEQALLARGFAAFATKIPEGSDYRVAVITTDQSSEPERAGQTNLEFSPDYPFHLMSADDSGCMDTNVVKGCFRGPDSQLRVLEALSMPPNALRAGFTANVSVGSCGSGEERGLAAMRGVLSAPAQCHQGFLREDANLLVIFVSDEDDAGSSTIEENIEMLTALKADKKKVRIAVIAGAVSGVPLSCSVGQGLSCGGLCDMPPPLGSGNSCSAGNPACPAGELCNVLENQCINEERRFWSSTQCGSCSFFNASDCCAAVAGVRYVTLARAWEAEVAMDDREVPVQGCEGSKSGAVCLVASICQESLDSVMEDIAARLVMEL